MRHYIILISILKYFKQNVQQLFKIITMGIIVAARHCVKIFIKNVDTGFYKDYRLIFKNFPSTPGCDLWFIFRASKAIPIESTCIIK